MRIFLGGREGCFQANSMVCQYTHATPCAAIPPTAAHKLSRPRFHLSHCARLKGSFAGDMEKSCVCLNMS